MQGLLDAPATGLVRRAMRPLFRCDWTRALFLHYAVDPATLAPTVPFPLDLRDGKAFVSLVAFTMERLRPSGMGRLGEWLFRPIATTQFLNLRTYVRHRGRYRVTVGIYFLAEFVSNPLCVPLGLPTFGLPYRLGAFSRRHTHESGHIAGTVVRREKSLRYHATLRHAAEFVPCVSGSLEEFLLERYAAFTKWGPLRRRFDVEHEPWLQVAVDADVEDDGLLESTGPWFRGAQLVAANYSPGVFGVGMGRPRWER